MPIYEYVCDDCGERYERIVMNKSTVVACPKCESAKKTVQLSVCAGEWQIIGGRQREALHRRWPLWRLLRLPLSLPIYALSLLPSLTRSAFAFLATRQLLQGVHPFPQS